MKTLLVFLLILLPTLAEAGSTSCTTYKSGSVRKTYCTQGTHMSHCTSYMSGSQRKMTCSD